MTLNEYLDIYRNMDDDSYYVMITKNFEVPNTLRAYDNVHTGALWKKIMESDPEQDENDPLTQLSMEGMRFTCIYELGVGGIYYKGDKF